MSKKKTKKKLSKKGTWEITFEDGEKIKTKYYPNPRMAVAEAMKERVGTVKSVKYKK